MTDKNVKADRVIAPVVAIGASAGGLKELEVFFKNLTNLDRVAFVVILHLAPSHESSLADIVSRFTNLNVTQPTRKTTVKPGNVYIIPPNKIIELNAGKICLKPYPEDIKNRKPIDIFFKSMSLSLKENSVSVILSGAGTDGSEGIKSVSEQNGLVIVQEPETAEYTSMPETAISTGTVDFILPTSEMPGIIQEYLKHIHDDKILHISADNRLIFDSIFKYLLKQTGNDFSGYKINTVYRRIQRRMKSKKIINLNGYFEFLKQNSEETTFLYKELLISVTNFFRDEETYHYLKDNLIPRIVSKAYTDTIRIWVPACATGEEAYSIAILFMEYLDRHEFNLKLQIFASDLDKDAIEKARKGLYPLKIKDDISEKILHKYFEKILTGYQIKAEVREHLIFAEQNLLSDPPYSKLDLISCRNFLIYLNNAQQKKVLSIFHYALNPDGYLLLGRSESLGMSSGLFTTEDRKNKVFHKINGLKVERNVWKLNFEEKRHPVGTHKEIKTEIADFTKAYILENLSPPCVVIDPEGEMLYVQGRTGKYLENTSGVVSTNILKNAREGLKIPLTNAIKQAGFEQHEIYQRKINVKTNGSYELIDLRVAPLNNADEHTKLFIVSFFPSVEVHDGTDSETFQSNDGVIESLKKELANKDVYLRNTIEELESTNEELKSSNEEAQSANEELQSANEELETSKEELQSVNEELVTTNSELNQRVDELSELNNNMKNLLAATDIATIFVDRELKIFKFTPAAKKIINLLESDIGRSISQFTNTLNYKSLADDIRTVLSNLRPVETAVKDQELNHFWMRISPYRTTDEKIEGAVITFTDITERKKADNQISLLNSIIENSLDGFDIVNENGLLEYVNKAYLKMWGYDSQDEILGTSPAGHCADEEMPLIIINKVNKEQKADFEFKAKRKDGSTFDVFMSVSTYEDIDGKRYYAGFSQDISEKVQQKKELDEYRNNLEEILKEKNEQLYKSEVIHRKISLMSSDYSYSYKVNDLNEYELEWSFGAFEKITGYKPAEILNTAFIKKLIHPDDFSEIINRRKKNAAGETATSDVRIITKRGEIKWIQDKSVPELDEKTGKLIRIISSATEITKRKNVEKALELSERKFRNIAENIPGLVYKYRVSNADDITLMYLSRSVESIFKIPYSEAKNDINLFLSLIHEEDLPGYKKAFEKAGKNLSFFDLKHRVTLHDGEIKWLHTRGTPSRDDEGGTVWDVLSFDITRQHAAEDKLLQSNQQMEILFKELHHRVKNNLQLVSSMLQLQANYIDDEKISAMYSENQHRIRCIAHLHELIYHSNDLNQIELNVYLSNITDYLYKSYAITDKDISLELNITELLVDIEMAVPLGLIVTELISNSFKHGFKDRSKGTLSLSLSKVNSKRYSLVVEDDGTGVPEDIFSNSEKSFGVFIVSSLVLQLDGDIHVRSKNGTKITISFYC